MKHRIEITVKKPANQKGKRKPAPRPLIRTGGSPDVSSRRKIGLINFWDLGQIKDGSNWIDLPFYFNPGYVYDLGYPYYPLSNVAPSLGDISPLKDLIFTIPIEQWESNYRPVSFGLGERYGISVEIGSVTYEIKPTTPEWQSRGLVKRFTPTNTTISGANAFSFIDFSSPSIKVTTALDFASPSIQMAESAKADIFLMPRVGLVYADSISNLGGSPPLLAFDRAFFQYSLLPREYYLQDAAWFGGKTMSAFVGDSDLVAAYKAKASALIGEVWRAYGYNQTPNPGAPPPDSSPSSVASFPAGTLISVQAIAGFEPQGSLIAIIKSNSVIYYVWRN